jgi:hypothetical protein
LEFIFQNISKFFYFKFEKFGKCIPKFFFKTIFCGKHVSKYLFKAKKEDWSIKETWD